MVDLESFYWLGDFGLLQGMLGSGVRAVRGGGGGRSWAVRDGKEGGFSWFWGGRCGGVEGTGYEGEGRGGGVGG